MQNSLGSGIYCREELLSLGARASRPHKTWQGRGDWLHRVGRFTCRLALEQRLDKYAGGTPALPGGNPWLARCRSLSRALFCRSILPPSHARLRILQKAQDKQDEKLLHSLQSLKYKPLIIKDLLWISPLQSPHYIPLFEKEPTGRSRMLVDGSAEYQPWVRAHQVEWQAARASDRRSLVCAPSGPPADLQPPQRPRPGRHRPVLPGGAP